MTRFLSIIGLALALVAFTNPLPAQDGKGQNRPRGGALGGGTGAMLGGGDSKLALIRNEQVQKELKITDEQKAKIAEVQKAFQTETGLGNLRDLSQEERQKRLAEAREKREKATADAEKKIDGILLADQTKRLGEIQLQQRGFASLKDAAVAKELKLSDDQTTKIAAAIQSGDDERRKLFQDRAGQGRGNQEAAAQLREKQQKIRQDTETKVLAVLTDAQKLQFEKMKGTPFKLERATFRAGGGAPGAPGGPGGQPKDGQGAEKTSKPQQKV